MSNIGEIICGTLGGGVNISVDDGGTWTSFMKSDICDNISCCVFYSVTSPVAGLIDKGIIRYDDWNYVDWVRSANLTYSSINAMIRLRNGDLWASMPYYGIFKSTNGGANWSNIGFSQTTSQAYPVQGCRSGLVLARNPNGGISRSTDNGLTWNLSGLATYDITAFGVDSTGNPLVGAKTLTAPYTCNLYKSTDNGVNWNLVFSKTDSTITSIAVNSSGYIFCALSFPPANPKDPNSIKTDLYTSTDGGVTWSHRPARGGVSGISFIGINFNGDIYLNDTNGLSKSVNNGLNWAVSIPKATTTVNSVAFTTNGHIFAGTGNGVMKSINNGTNWTTITLPTANQTVLKILASPTNQVFAALAGIYGFQYTADEGTTWNDLRLGMIQAGPKDMSIGSDGFIFYTCTSMFRGIEPNFLQPPVTLNPPQNSDGVLLNGPFNWNKYFKADLYEFQMSTDMDFTNILQTFITGDTITNSLYTMNTYSWYYWRVRSRTNNAISDWTKTQQFTTIIDAPTLKYPSKDTTGLDLSITLKWLKLPGAGGYTINIATDANFNNIITNKTITDTFYLQAGLKIFTKYYWRVCGKMSKTTGPWSDVWNFNTKLNTVTLISPQNNAYGLPAVTQLTWNLSTGATKYEVQIARDSLFQQMVFEGSTQSNGSHKTKVLELFTTYYWRIRAVDDVYGYSDWSYYWKFTTIIDAVILISPNNQTYDLKPTVSLEWKNYPKATGYQFQIATDVNFSQIVNDNISVDSKTDIAPGILDYFSRYFWRVRTKVNNYLGLWSDPWEFTTGLGKVILNSPTNNSKNQSLDMTFTWNPVTGADSYLFILAKDTTFTDIIKQADTNDVQIDVQSLDYFTTYYFHVKAKYNKGEGDWSDTWSFTTHDASSVGEIQSKYASINEMFPNPFSTQLNINYTLATDANVKFRITDTKGKTVLEIPEDFKTVGDYNLNIQPKDLTSGTYFLQMFINGDILVRKIVSIK